MDATLPKSRSIGGVGARTSPYRADIDGLRAVSILAVVGYHAQPSLIPGGFAGVDVFFVISGFLITGIILQDMQDHCFSTFSFYRRRIKRLFPALIAVIAATFAAGWFYLLPHEFHLLGKHLAYGAFYIINFALRGEAGYFDVASHDKPLMHLWSLAIEEQFYLVWPLFLIAVTRLKIPSIGLAALTAASLIANVLIARKNPNSAFFLPQARFWELSVGGLLAATQRQSNGAPLSAAINCLRHFFGASIGNDLICVAGLSMIIGAVLMFDSGMAYPGGWALLPCTGALLVLASGPQSMVSRYILSNRAMVFVGLISYPLYLWHWPLLSFGSISIFLLAHGVCRRCFAPWR